VSVRDELFAALRDERLSEEIAGVPIRLATDEPEMPDAMTRPGTRAGKRVAVLRVPAAPSVGEP